MKGIFDLVEEYKDNVRPFWGEEPFDYLIYRPLAFLAVKGTYSLPLAPNHFSLLALATAFASGLCLASGTSVGLVCGGIGIFFFGVWDCCDGMLARMKGNGDRYGQFVDMFVDVLSCVCVYGGLLQGLKGESAAYPWMALLSAIAICVHAGIYNFYKKQFFFYESHNPGGRFEEIEFLKKDWERLRGEGGSLFARFLIRSFLIFAAVQIRSAPPPHYDVEDYVKSNRLTLCLWSFIAGSGHLAILSLSLILSKVEVYFGFSLVFSNLWLLWAWFVQRCVSSGLSRVETA